MYYGERFNAWTHLIGSLLALVGAIWLLMLAIEDGTVWKIVSASIYGLSLILLYSVSTIYHCMKGSAKRLLQKLDHLSIYLLIAGSYTPFCLVTLNGTWGWSLFGIVWGLALIGMLQEIRPRSEARILSLVIYAVMGWIALVAIKPLLAALGTAGFIWLFAGGIVYTLGIYFFVFDQRRHWHGIWHLFVLGGSSLHFVAVSRYVM